MQPLDAAAEDDGGAQFRFDPDATVRVDANAGSVPECPDGGHTTLSGTVYAPNGTLPLYNVIVYTPTTNVLDPVPSGVSCEPCGAFNSSKATATALSDAKGHFVLVDPPAGKDVPLVVQVGKWRRMVTVPNVTACTDNALTDPDLTRLPKDTTEGSIPRIAVTTGGVDRVACLLPKLGIDASQFGVSGSTAVTLYAGGGGSGPAGIRPAQSLWNDVSEMGKYDMLILSCEGSEDIGDSDAGPYGSAYGTKTAASFAAMTRYLDMGGRIFGTDFMYTVWKDSPDSRLSSAATIPGGAPAGSEEVNLNTSFPKGKALADWLAWQYPTVPYGTIELDTVYDNVSSANASVTQVWGTGAPSYSTGTTTGSHPRFMTVNAPVGSPPDQQCGKAVHLDAHVNQMDSVGPDFPASCTSSFSAAEKAFAFFFFDLASCIQLETATPTPPQPYMPH